MEPLGGLPYHNLAVYAHTIKLSVAFGLPKAEEYMLVVELQVRCFFSFLYRKAAKRLPTRPHEGLSRFLVAYSSLSGSI